MGAVVTVLAFFLLGHVASRTLLLAGAGRAGDHRAVPGAVFALAAGAIFSLAQGTALVWLGTSLGQTLAFMVGRCAHLAEVPGCGV